MKMKGKMRRVGAIILAFVLVATMSQWPTMVNAAGSEGVVTITNPGFESGVSTGWTKDSSDLLNRAEISQETGNVWAGEYSAKINASNQIDWFEISYITLTSDSYELTAGKTYTFGGYVALQTGNEGSATQQIYAQLVDSNGDVISDAVTSVVAPENGVQGWTKIMATYTPATTQSVQIQFHYSGTNGAMLDNSWAAYVDNVFCSLENEDFELTNSTDFPEAWESEDVTIATSTTTQNGAQSMHLKKDNLNEASSVYGTALYAIDKTDITSDFELEWGMYQSSKDSDSFVRLDATLYDENYQVIETFYGTRSMLSRESSYCDYTKVSTVMTVPYEAKYISYEVVLSSGNTDVLVDNIFCNVATEVERTPDSSVTGWSAEEIWYPENEKEDGVWQFRYFRTKVTLPSAIVGTELRLQVVADDSFSVVIDENFVWNALYVNGKPYYNVAAKTIKNNKTVLTYIIPVSDLGGANELLIATRVLNCNSYAGLVMQGFAILNQGSGFNYETVIETTASNTVTSKLECTEPMDGDNYNEFATWREPDSDANWYAVDYDDSQWILAESRGIPPYGNLGDVPFDWKNSDGFFIYDSGEDRDGRDVSVTAGEKAEVIVPGAYAALYGADVYTNGKPETPTKVHALLYRASEYADKNNVTALDVIATVDVDITWVSDQTGSTFTIFVPDYLPTGTYKVILQQVRFANGANTDNVLANLNVTASDKSIATSRVATENGVVRLKVNDETISPIMYLRPSETVYYNYATMSEFKNTGIDLYSTYNGFLDGADGATIWTAEDTIDYDAFDLEIYKTLDLNPNAMVMVNMNLDAPDWWMEANPDECIKLEDGTVLNQVSFASTKYREEAAEVVKQLVQHMVNASYKHRVVGVKLSAGRTYEWMNFKQSDDGYIYTMDYSEPMVTAFGGTLPAISIRSDLSDGVLLDPSEKSEVIKYNELLSQCVTDSVLAYAKAVKDVNANWVVGAYNGYLWNESSAAGIGSIHTTVEQILNSSYIDYLSSPVNYSERIDGYATEYMAASESIAAHGKLYILEQDNRTAFGYVYSNPDAEGATYTAEDSVKQLTRDTAFDLVSGNGLWYFDMQGGWFDNADIEESIRILKEEYDTSLTLDMSTNSEVAVFVGSETYNYLVDDTLDNSDGTNDTYKLMSQLYQAQRLELSKMGTSYDTYMIEDLTSSNVTTDWSQYKLHIILSPFELSEAERTAIADKLQKNGNYVLWIYLPGVSDGSAMNATNIQNTTGMSVTLNTAETTLEAKISNDNFGVVDDFYGASYTYKTPYVVIGADGVTELATYTNGNGIAAAMKDCGTYTSVYSAVPNVPADALRDLCVAAGVHIYAEDKDVVVETNASYVTVHSQTSGNKTVVLPANENGYEVFDVINQTKVTVTDNCFTASVESGDAGLYRITEKALIEIINKDWNGVLIENANFADWAEGVPVGFAFNDNSKAAISQTIVEEKGYVAELANPNGLSELYFEYNVDVEAGKTYELSFDAKFTGTGQAVYVIYDQNWTSTHAIADYALSVAGTWNRISATFTATTDETVHVRLAMWGGTTESVLELTNLRMQVIGDNELIPNGTFIDENVNCDTGYFGWYKMQYATTTKGPNLIVNSSFEEDLTSSWIVAEREGVTVSTSNDYAASGSSSVKVSSNVIGLYDQPQQIVSNVEPNTEYTISWKVLIDSTEALGNVYAFPFVYEFDENATAVTGQHALDGTTAAGHSYRNWLEFTRTITTAENTRVLRIDLWNNFASNTGCVYWDDIMVYASNVNCATVDTMSIQKSSLTGISGLDITGNGCGIQANTTRATVKDATYILKYNAALSGSGDTKLIMYKEVLDDAGVLTGYDERLQESISLTKEANTVKLLFASQDSGKYLVRFAMLETANTTKLSLGNISMKLNRGDFDENNGGYPDSADFVEMRKAMIDHEEATENVKTFAEMNADGVVNSKDLVRMKLYGARMK